VLLFVFLYGNGFVSAQSCSIQSDDPSPVCQGTVVTYTLSGLPPLVTQIVWLTPGGSQMTQGNSVSVHWDFSLTTTVTANLFDNTGAPLGSCTLTPVVVQEQPAPMIVPDIAPGCGGHKSAEGDYGSPSYCENTTVNFNANGDGGTYSWEVTGNAQLMSPAVGNSIEVLTGADGFFTITLTETSSAGCVGISEEVYEVVEPPTVSFTELTHLSQNPITVCRGESLLFLGTAIDPNELFLVDRIWQVYLGGTLVASGTGLNFNYDFNDPGTYTVTYLVSNCAGCVGSYSVQVIVTQETVPTIICPSVVCQNGPWVEYCTDADCTGFNWSVVGGTIETGQGTSCIQVSWTTVPPSGFGSVTLNTSGCGAGVCAAPVSIEVPILNTGADMTGPSSTCDPDAHLIYFLPNWPGAVYQWSIININATNGGTVVATGVSDFYRFGVHLLNFTGTFTVHAVVTHPLAGCEFEYDKTIVAGNHDITGETAYCRGEDVVLSVDPLPSGATASWQILNPAWTSGPLNTPQVTIPASAFPNSGAFVVNVIITLSNGDVLKCKNVIVRILREVDPVADILGPQNICLDQPYTYTAIPDAGLGGSVTWAGVGGTPSPATGNPTSVTWTAAAPPYELTATRSEFVPIFPGSNVGKVCVSDPYTRSDFTRIPIPSALKIDAFVKPCADHQFTYTACYDGGTDYFWSIDPALGSIVSGQGTSSIQIYWNVPLGSNNQATIHLTAIVCGQALSTSLTLTIIEGPTPVISGPAVICEGSNATFTATVSGYSAGATYHWQVENNGVLTSFPPTSSSTLIVPASLLHPGAGVVRVTASTTGGCIGSGGDAFDFTVVENPKPGIFTPDVPLCFQGQPAACTINLYAQNYTGVGATFSWSYNNTIVGTNNPHAANINPLGFPSGYGTYTVTVARTFTEYPGLTCYANDTYTIYRPSCNPGPKVPVVYFDNWALPSCGVVEVWGTVPNVPPNQWNNYVANARWWVEDFAGTVSPNPKPITSAAGLHTTLSVFSQPGFYPVWLEVQMIDQSTGLPFPAYSTSRRVVEIPVAPDFNWDAGCGSAPGTYDVNFTDMSEVIPPKPPQPGTTISSWTWTINGAFASNAQDFIRTFTAGATAQTYEVCLTVTSATAVYEPGMPYTCTICKTITIPGQPNVSITPLNANVCEGTPIQFQATYNPANILDLVWNFDDGTGSNVDNPVKTYNYVPGNNDYNVTATFTDNYGCTIIKNSMIHVNENNLEGLIVETSGDCNSMAVLTFLGTPSMESYLWSPGGATTTSLLVEENGIYSLTVTDEETGCTYSPPSEEVLVQSPFPAGILGAQHICRGNAIVLSVVSVPGYTFTWTSSTNQGGTGLNFTINAGNIPASTNSVTVTVTASQKNVDCAVESIVIDIDPSPATPILSYTFGCPPYPITVSAFNGANQPINVSWVSWGNGGVGSAGYGPQITRFASGFINATIVNEFGCVAKTGVNLTSVPYISMLTGCYTVCDTALENGGYVLPAPTIGGGQIVDWQWFHNDQPLGLPAPPNVQALPLTEALEGEIFLRIHKRFQNSNGTYTTCQFDSDFFCLKVDTCGTDTSECRPPGATVRTIVCLQESDGFTSYYVHWDYPADGVAMPCMYAQNLPIHNANGDHIGDFTAVDNELLGNSIWHMEGLFTMYAPNGPFDACWDIPFCLISTGELCSITTVCTDTGDPEANAEILYGCDGSPCPRNFEWRMGVACENDPTTPATHLINLIVSYQGIPPGPPGCNTYDVLINTVTGTTVPPNQLINIQGVAADGSGNLLLTPANYPELSFDWYDQIGTDLVCLQVVIRYDDQCYMPPGFPQDGRICTQRFCSDASNLDCSPEREGSGPYNFRSECRSYTEMGYLYTFEIELVNETSIAGYSLIPGQSSGNAVLISVTGNVIQGVYYSPTPNPIFHEGITIRRPDGSTANYIIEGIMPYCGEGDGKGGDGKEGGPRSMRKAGADSQNVQMTVVPNPASDQVKVQYQLPSDFVPNQNAVVIHNSIGAEVLRQQLDETTSGGVTLQLGNLPSGWYQVSLWHEARRIATQKLVLMKH